MWQCSPDRFVPRRGGLFTSKPFADHRTRCRTNRDGRTVCRRPQFGASGQQFIIPVQAKGGTDRIGAVQAEQDLALCRDVFPELTPRPVAVQFVRDTEGEVIVMFELKQQGDDILIADERHYRLVPADQISTADLRSMEGT